MNVIASESYQQFESLPARLAGVVRTPRALFEAVIMRPRWAGVLLVTWLIPAVCGIALMQTPVGRQALVDQWERTAIAFGQRVDDQQYDRLVEMTEQAGTYAAVTSLASGPLLTFALATAIFAMFNGVLRGKATWRQALAVVAHAGVILALRQVIAAPLNYSRETLASPTTLTMFFPMLDEASPAARFFGVIDLFVVWWVVVLAIGVARLYGRPARTTAYAFIGAYVGLAALLAIVMAVSGRSV